MMTRARFGFLMAAIAVTSGGFVWVCLLRGSDIVLPPGPDTVGAEKQHDPLVAASAIPQTPPERLGATPSIRRVCVDSVGLRPIAGALARIGTATAASGENGLLELPGASSTDSTVIIECRGYVERHWPGLDWVPEQIVLERAGFLEVIVPAGDANVNVFTESFDFCVAKAKGRVCRFSLPSGKYGVVASEATWIFPNGSSCEIISGRTTTVVIDAPLVVDSRIVVLEADGSSVQRWGAWLSRDDQSDLLLAQRRKRMVRDIASGDWNVRTVPGRFEYCVELPHGETCRGWVDIDGAEPVKIHLAPKQKVTVQVGNTSSKNASVSYCICDAGRSAFASVSELVKLLQRGELAVLKDGTFDVDVRVSEWSSLRVGVGEVHSGDGHNAETRVGWTDPIVSGLTYAGLQRVTRVVGRFSGASLGAAPVGVRWTEDLPNRREWVRPEIDGSFVVDLVGRGDAIAFSRSRDEWETVAPLPVDVVEFDMHSTWSGVVTRRGLPLADVDVSLVFGFGRSVTATADGNGLVTWKIPISKSRVDLISVIVGSQSDVSWSWIGPGLSIALKN